MPDYIDLRGHQTYSYEWENNGEAVLLLHGGLSQTSHWDYVLTPDLEPDFHLFAYDRSGHGFTADQTESFHFKYQINCWCCSSWTLQLSFILLNSFDLSI